MDTVHRDSLVCGRGKDGVAARVGWSFGQQGKLPDLGLGEPVGCSPTWAGTSPHRMLGGLR